MPRQIHYVGSTPFNSAAETFRALTRGMQSPVSRLPDGELGGRRMAAAEKYVSSYAVGTDCGLGRRPPETIAEVLRLHRVAVERF